MNKIPQLNSVISDKNEEEYKLQEFFWILHQADKRCLEELVADRIERRIALDSQIEESDRKVVKTEFPDQARNIT